MGGLLGSMIAGGIKGVANSRVKTLEAEDSDRRALELARQKAELDQQFTIAAEQRANQYKIDDGQRAVKAAADKEAEDASALQKLMAQPRQDYAYGRYDENDKVDGLYQASFAEKSPMGQMQAIATDPRWSKEATPELLNLIQAKATLDNDLAKKAEEARLKNGEALKPVPFGEGGGMVPDGKGGWTPYRFDKQASVTYQHSDGGDGKGSTTTARKAADNDAEILTARKALHGVTYDEAVARAGRDALFKKQWLKANEALSTEQFAVRGKKGDPRYGVQGNASTTSGSGTITPPGQAKPTKQQISATFQQSMRDLAVKLNNKEITQEQYNAKVKRLKEIAKGAGL
jgi:hypothetical protein